jgi:hypothetical protein
MPNANSRSASARLALSPRVRNRTLGVVGTKTRTVNDGRAVLGWTGGLVKGGCVGLQGFLSLEDASGVPGRAAR